jgi:hypothetical protein
LLPLFVGGYDMSDSGAEGFSIIARNRIRRGP